MRGVIPLALFLLTATAVSHAADALPYCENVAPEIKFNPQGKWTITGVAGHAEVVMLSGRQTHQLLGTTFAVHGDRVRFWNLKTLSWKNFPVSLIRQDSYDTQSREFWLDFRTDPKDLALPRYVSAVDLELGTLLAAAGGKVLLDFEGTWFTLARAAESETAAR